MTSSSIEAISILRDLLQKRVGLGQGQQAAFDWPKDKWTTALPQDRAHLENLPDRLDRTSVAHQCRDAAASPEGARSAFITAMAWGYGDRGYGRYRTNRVLANPQAADRLCAVAKTLADEGALAAYRRLATADDLRLHGLGPAFGTKYLYFCQSPTARPRALILDALVARWLREAGLLEVDPVPWSTGTYGRYLGTMHDWAAELETSADTLELAMFEEAASATSSSWNPNKRPAP